MTKTVYSFILGGHFMLLTVCCIMSKGITQHHEKQTNITQPDIDDIIWCGYWEMHCCHCFVFSSDTYLPFQHGAFVAEFGEGYRLSTPDPALAPETFALRSLGWICCGGFLLIYTSKNQGLKNHHIKSNYIRKAIKLENAAPGSREMTTLLQSL